MYVRPYRCTIVTLHNFCWMLQMGWCSSESLSAWQILLILYWNIIHKYRYKQFQNTYHSSFKIFSVFSDSNQPLSPLLLNIVLLFKSDKCYVIVRRLGLLAVVRYAWLLLWTCVGFLVICTLYFKGFSIFFSFVIVGTVYILRVQYILGIKWCRNLQNFVCLSR